MRTRIALTALLLLALLAVFLVVGGSVGALELGFIVIVLVVGLVAIWR